MIWPTICIDNFFNDPDKVVEFAKTLNYKTDKYGEWPGERTKELCDLDKNFFEFFGKKVLSILYPLNYNEISYHLSLNFQKISKKYVDEGWVHRDNGCGNQLTCIVYLSKHKQCGTSIFDSKKICSPIINVENKRKMFLTDDFLNQKKFLKENNEQFEETISIKSKYNRLIMFDAAHFHAAQKYVEDNIQEDRLTLVGFFLDIIFPKMKLNGIEHKRIL